MNFFWKWSGGEKTVIYFAALLITLILLLISNPVLAGWISDGSAAYAKIKAVNHWQGLLAGVLAIAFLRSIPVVLKAMNPVYIYLRVAVAFVIGVIGVLILGYFLAEYWPVFETIGSFIAEIIKVMFS